VVRLARRVVLVEEAPRAVVRVVAAAAARVARASELARVVVGVAPGAEGRGIAGGRGEDRGGGVGVEVAGDVGLDVEHEAAEGVVAEPARHRRGRFVCVAELAGDDLGLACREVLGLDVALLEDAAAVDPLRRPQRPALAVLQRARVAPLVGTGLSVRGVVEVGREGVVARLERHRPVHVEGLDGTAESVVALAAVLHRDRRRGRLPRLRIDSRRRREWRAR